jgi:ABC-type glycerol-3-phosphate transport system substrate-binding protein
MNQTARRFLLLALVLVTVVSLGGRPVAAQGKVKIVWFVGLGTGTNDQQIATEKEVVADFNASQDQIELEIQIAPSFGVAMDTITTLLASGNPPDIAGPVGVGGSNALADQWMDLKPLIDKNKYDLTPFDPAVLDLYKTLNGGYSAIPFAVFPSIIYYNPALFDEAGLKYPPSKVGDKYELDGKQVDWNYDTVAQVAKLLTVDKDGNDATSDKFDPKNIVQYGMNFQWALMRLNGRRASSGYGTACGKITSSRMRRLKPARCSSPAPSTPANWLWPSRRCGTPAACRTPLASSSGKWVWCPPRLTARPMSPLTPILSVSSRAQRT